MKVVEWTTLGVFIVSYRRWISQRSPWSRDGLVFSLSFWKAQLIRSIYFSFLGSRDWNGPLWASLKLASKGLVQVALSGKRQLENYVVQSIRHEVLVYNPKPNTYVPVPNYSEATKIYKNLNLQCNKWVKSSFFPFRNLLVK